MKYIYRIFVFLTVVLLLGALGLAFIFAPRGQKLDNENKIKNKEEQEPEKISIFNDNGDIVNILLIGIDSSDVTYEKDEDSKRADTIMLLSIDPKHDRIRLLSIPRDTYYKLKGYDNYRMNAAYSRGGIDLQVSSVEDFLGIKISHYVTVNYEAVEELVDAIGGVEVYTPKYKYIDPSTVPPLEINFEEGLHLLNGKDSVKYLRIRKIYKDQDLDRIKAQQDFIMKIFDKMKSPRMLLKLPKLVSIANKHIETDMNYGQLSYLAYYGVTLDKEDIAMKTVPGRTKKGSPLYFVNKKDAMYAASELERLRDNPKDQEEVKDYTEEELADMTEAERAEAEQKMRDKKLRDKLKEEAIQENSSNGNSNSNKTSNSKKTSKSNKTSKSKKASKTSSKTTKEKN
ncbi:LCP family protein [Peptoniphilus sp. DNF00840]|uniref:LCP family protein n=1 Tax=Peptoniphilus sp. DNF00840 TaxID=1477000 RepID=UPI000794ED76|nr:LCP family protein [Peptoniphilus sp. DNF00840]KXB70943.1 cell envelope-like function transcriptional attenuator common domain protein [Peptoniphilus sp. DNF00840]